MIKRNDELILALHKTAGNLSYYNAAEGDCWRQEVASRAMALSAFRKACEEAHAAGIDVNKELAGHGYLI